MADVVSKGELEKNKLDCFNKLCIFEAVTSAGNLHSIGLKGKAISSHKHNGISPLLKKTNIRWIISVNISVKQPVTFT